MMNKQGMNKRLAIGGALGGGIAVAALAGFLLTGQTAAVAGPIVEVYKTESCGCCGDWVTHLEEAGFTVKAKNVANPGDYRAKFGIPVEMGSCHTGYVAGYALEGHVPAAEVKRLLAEKPEARGLTVPGMPMGSPGMEGDYKDAYDVLLVKADGSTAVYQHYSAN